jgi:hypothetical protein
MNITILTMGVFFLSGLFTCSPRNQGLSESKSNALKHFIQTNPESFSKKRKAVLLSYIIFPLSGYSNRKRKRFFSHTVVEEV